MNKATLLRNKIVGVFLSLVLVATSLGLSSVDTYAESWHLANGVVNCSPAAILRSKATKKSKVVNVLAKGTTVTIHKEIFTNKYKTGSKRKWYLVSSSYGNGYIRSDLIIINSYGSVKGTATKKITYRKGAGKKMTKRGTLKKNSTFTIVMVAKAKGSSAKWYKIRKGKKYYYIRSSGVRLGASSPASAVQSEAPANPQSAASAVVAKNACTWAINIANDNSFHYGKGKHAHHNGCYFCGTRPKSKRNNLTGWEKTYCCNPFVHAAYAHGGGDQTMLKMCKKANSFDWDTIKKTTLFTGLGHPDQSTLLPGDVLCWTGHMAMYIGNGKYVDAGLEDDNIPGSKTWNSSIAVRTLTASKYKQFKKVYRYVGAN